MASPSLAMDKSSSSSVSSSFIEESQEKPRAKENSKPLESYFRRHVVEQSVTCSEQELQQFRKNYPERVVKGSHFQSIARRTLNRTAEVLNKLDIPFVILGGTLLGWYRECGFIGHTTDLDIGVFASDFTPSMAKAFQDAGFALFRKFGNFGRYGFEYSWKREGCQVDIFPFYEENVTIWHSTWLDAVCNGNICTGGSIYQMVWPKPWEFAPTWFEGSKVLVPTDPDRWLSQLYGPDWRKPVESWHWVWSMFNLSDGKKPAGRYKGGTLPPFLTYKDAMSVNVTETRTDSFK